VEFLTQFPVVLALALVFRLLAVVAVVALELVVVPACLPAMAHLAPAVHTKQVSVCQLLKYILNTVI
jgi:hypothetical protein